MINVNQGSLAGTIYQSSDFVSIDEYKTIYIPSDNLTRRFPCHHWRLDSIITAYATTYGDDTGSHAVIMEENNCVDSATTHIAGGRTWLFDGATSYGQTLQNVDCSEGDWSFGCWGGSTGAGGMGIMGTQTNHAYSAQTRPDLYIATSGNNVYVLFDYAGTEVNINSAAPINNFYHFFVTIKKTNYYIAAGTKWMITFYLDGVEIGRDFSDYDIPKSDLIIGNYTRTDGTYWLAGNMQDVRVYDYALTHDEVLNIYNGSGSGLGTFEDIIKL